MDFLQTSRPLLIEQEADPKYPYFKSGSAFLVRYRDALFALTADHCVKDYHADQIRIPVSDGSRDFLAFNTKWKPTHAGATDHLDFWILRVDEPATPGYASITAIDIDQDAVARARAAYRPGKMLAISGYPGAAENIVDYDRQVIRTQRVISWTSYAGVGPTPHSHLLKDEDRLVTEYAGYSGSPILSPHGETADVAGIAVRANDSSGVILSIDIAAVWSGFRKTAI